MLSNVSSALVMWVNATGCHYIPCICVQCKCILTWCSRVKGMRSCNSRHTQLQIMWRSLLRSIGTMALENGAHTEAINRPFNNHLSSIKTTIFSVMTQLSQVSL